MYLYQTYEEKLSHPDIGSYISFGIIVLIENNKQKDELFRISDVSVNKALVEKLSILCTKEQLDPVHIYDVIEDNI